MKLLSGTIDFLLGGPKVGGRDEERLRRWLAAPPASLVLPHGRARYVVVAIEASGVGTRRERLFSLDAVAVDGLRIDLSDCFGAVLRQRRPSAAADVVTHGIGGQAQAAGRRAGGRDARLPRIPGQGAAGRVPGRASRAASSSAPCAGSWARRSRTRASTSPRSCRRCIPQDRCATLVQWLERFGLAEGLRGDAPASPIAVAQLLQAALDAATRAGLVNAWQLAGLQQAPRRTDPR